VVTWIDGQIEQTTNYFDIEQARAAALAMSDERRCRNSSVAG
jgi:hypothetical protein